MNDILAFHEVASVSLTACEVRFGVRMGGAGRAHSSTWRPHAGSTLLTRVGGARLVARVTGTAGGAPGDGNRASRAVLTLRRGGAAGEGVHRAGLAG